jgi:lysine biosynthesis protein LysW
MRAKCPECETWVPLPKDAIEGEHVVCPGCGEQLELINLGPPELDYADWEDWSEE